MNTNESETMLKNIKRFLKTAPIIAKRRKIIHEKNNKCPLCSKNQSKFETLFNGTKLCSELTIDDYVDRIAMDRNMRGYTLCIAAFLFFKVITKPHLFSSYEDYTIKLFSTCLYIAHKLYLDRNYSSAFMSKLLGIPKKKLNRRELYLCGESVFNFNFGVNEAEINKFILYLKTF